MNREEEAEDQRSVEASKACDPYNIPPRLTCRRELTSGVSCLGRLRLQSLQYGVTTVPTDPTSGISLV